MKRQCAYLYVVALILLLVPQPIFAQDRDRQAVEDAFLEALPLLDWSERVKLTLDRQEKIAREIDDAFERLAQSEWKDIGLIRKLRLLVREQLDLLQNLIKPATRGLAEVYGKIERKLRSLSSRFTSDYVELKSHFEKSTRYLEEALDFKAQSGSEYENALKALESRAVGRFEKAKAHFQKAIESDRKRQVALDVSQKEMDAGLATFARLANAVGFTDDSRTGSTQATKQREPPGSPLSPEKRQGGLDVIPRIVRDNEPAVVLITTKNVDGQDLRQGSGFIVDQSGIVVTNHHVVEGAVSATVRLSGGSKHEILGVVALNPDHDLAILKIKGANFPTVKLGDSHDLVKGEKVITISSPEGLPNVVSDGIVSSLWSHKGITLIQTTAPVSEGSSGGPLLNLRGEVVGITSWIKTEGQNLNFAVPINSVKPLIASSEVRMTLPMLALRGYIPESSAQIPSPPPAPSKVPPPPAGPTPSPSDTAPDVTIFLRALDDFASTNYDRAITGFETYISQSANADLIPTAYYLLGESYYNAKYYASAIKSFDVVIEVNPDDLTVVGAMLKQGYSYLELGVIERGQATLRKLIRRFPQSSEAQQAVRRLQELGLQ